MSKHALDWADASGFATRFPGAELIVDEGRDQTIAIFMDGPEARAELAYRKAAREWALDGLSYC